MAGFDPLDQLSDISVGTGRDITAAPALASTSAPPSLCAARFERTASPGPDVDEHSAGNGSIMRRRRCRCSSAVIRKPPRAAGESSRTTHGAREAIDACRYMAGLIIGAFRAVHGMSCWRHSSHPSSASGSRAAVAENPRHRRRLVSPARTARDRRHRLCRRVSGGGPLGVREEHSFRARRAARGQPGRRCGYDRGRVPSDRGCCCMAPKPYRRDAQRAQSSQGLETFDRAAAGQVGEARAEGLMRLLPA